MSEMAIFFLGKSHFIIQCTLSVCSQKPENVGIAVNCVSEAINRQCTMAVYKI